MFVDTSGFFALVVRQDKNHDHADELFSLAFREAWQLVTTNVVIIESHALLLHRTRRGQETALKFVDAIQNDPYEVIRIRRDDELNAISVIQNHADKLYSLCDALSFVVMERLQITETIAFDRDFRSYGRFAVL